MRLSLRPGSRPIVREPYQRCLVVLINHPESLEKEEEGKDEDEWQEDEGAAYVGESDEEKEKPHNTPETPSKDLQPPQTLCSPQPTAAPLSAGKNTSQTPAGVRDAEAQELSGNDERKETSEGEGEGGEEAKTDDDSSCAMEALEVDGQDVEASCSGANEGGRVEGGQRDETSAEKDELTEDDDELVEDLSSTSSTSGEGTGNRRSHVPSGGWAWTATAINVYHSTSYGGSTNLRLLCPTSSTMATTPTRLITSQGIPAVPECFRKALALVWSRASSFMSSWGTTGIGLPSSSDMTSFMVGGATNTPRVDEPVSKANLKSCGGVPMVSCTKYCVPCELSSIGSLSTPR
eukprot:765540-Hanusia_phi.AAC.3